MSTNFIDPLAFAQSRADKAYKYSFLETDKMLCGINCLLQGQSQPLHDHSDQDKFYLVIAGHGQFTVEDTTRGMWPGHTDSRTRGRSPWRRQRGRGTPHLYDRHRTLACGSLAGRFHPNRYP